MTKSNGKETFIVFKKKISLFSQAAITNAIIDKNLSENVKINGI